MLKLFGVMACIAGIYVFSMTGQMKAQPDTSEVLWVDLNSPSETRRRSSLWQWQVNASQRCLPQLEFLNVSNENAPVKRNEMFPRGWHELQYTRVQLYAIQACAYAAMNRWVQLANDLDIQNWSLNSGSLVGQVCYESMVPWDDDIDVVVFGYECDKLQQFFEGLLSSPHQLDVRFHSKTVDEEFEMFRISKVISFLLYYMSLVTDKTAFVTRFKLRSKLQQNRGDILGLDVECRSMPSGGINSSMMRDVRFGPTTARVLNLPDMSVIWPHKTIGC
jgi:hypothetical protein